MREFADMAQTRNLPLLGFLQATASITRELVALAQHLGGAELAQARRDRRVLLDVDRQVEECLVPRGHL